MTIKHYQTIGPCENGIRVNTGQERKEGKFFFLKKKKKNHDVEAGVDYGVAPFLSWSKVVCDYQSSIMRDRGPSTMTITAFICK